MQSKYSQNAVKCSPNTAKMQPKFCHYAVHNANVKIQLKFSQNAVKIGVLID